MNLQITSSSSVPGDSSGRDRRCGKCGHLEKNRLNIVEATWLHCANALSRGLRSLDISEISDGTCTWALHLSLRALYPI